MKWAFGILSVLLVAGNIFWAALYFAWHSKAASLQANQDAIEEKAARAGQSKQQLTKDVQAAVDSQEIAGLYKWWATGFDKLQIIDLRSDGTGQFDNGFGGSPIKTYWQKITDKKISIDKHGVFKIENGDLIDQRGNRWLHVR